MLWRIFIEYEEFLNWSILFIDRILSSTTNPGQSGSGSNDKERVFHISQISRTGPSWPDAI